LRVGHVTLGLEVGGQEKLLVEFARHACREQFELFFVSLGSRGPLAADIEACGWLVAALNEPDGLRPRIILRLAQLFRRWRLDVVHTHDDRPLLYGSVAALLARVPRRVHTKHYGQVQHITRRQTALARLAARLTDAFVCVSQDGASQTLHRGVGRGKVQTIWNGIDLSRFAYTGPQPNGPVVTVARLSAEKDVQTLIRAVAFNGSRFHVEVAGDGPCRPGLERLIDELHLHQHVRLLGQVSDIPALLARASLFVLPSHTEGISLTILEAMARGLPVIAARVGGNPEVVVDGETGLLVPPGDPAKLACAIAALQRNPALRSRMGQAGRRRAEQCFDVRRMVARYEALYRNLPASNGDRHATPFRVNGWIRQALPEP
jgi:glycosyltransferase involved in cell wall biosynthesis